jgi:DUF4097 and DUF4098 domain-containing protein YvlB
MSTTRNVAALLLLGTAAAAAQQPPASKPCDDAWVGRQGGAHVCEVREVTIRAPKMLSVDSTPNGGIRVSGADRKDVLVRATVNAWAEDEAQARALAGEVTVHTEDMIRADGPEQRGRTGWSVSYEILAPRVTDLSLQTRNGGVEIANVRGNLDFETTNGGLRLDSVAGNVRGRTTNGGVDVTLGGKRWDGEALDVRTTNGGVRMRVPEKYSARLETRTVNGRLNIDFPVTVQGRIGREIATTLGAGGPLVRAETTNGGVQISRY